MKGRRVGPLEEERPIGSETEDLRTIRTFMDLLSHDINNHIYGATGYMELLETMVRGDEPKERFLKNSMSEVRAIAALLENLRLITMISTEPFVPEPVEIRTRLAIASESVRYYLDDRELELALDRSTPDVRVRGDRFLHDVLVQILSNSIKNDPSPVVVVSARWTAGRGVVEVILEDFGKGMKDEVKRSALIRYAQVVGEGNIHGKGMGLSLVRSVMERYGGMIRLEDRVLGDHSKGLRVVLALPLWED
jgi:signal transduction histidine kinase